METEEELLQLIVAALNHRQELCPLPGEQAVMQLTVNQGKADVK